jgi:hypothetical protein
MAKSYARTHRPPDVKAINISIDAEAYKLLQCFSPTSKAYGRFLSRLLYEHAVRHGHVPYSLKAKRKLDTHSS